jgi:hypothetical protein
MSASAAPAGSDALAALAPQAAAEVARLLADPPAEVYADPLKGRGLRARRPIAAGEAFAVFVGPLAAVEPAAGGRRLAGAHEFAYLRQGVLADLAAAPKPLVPLGVNAALVNDPMPFGAYRTLAISGAFAFAQEYECPEPAIAFDPLPPAAEGWGALRARARRRHAAGEPLEAPYGLEYWLQLAAARALPGASVDAAWTSFEALARGGPHLFWAAAKLVLRRSPRGDDEARLAAGALGFNRYPVGLACEPGAGPLFAGRWGDSFHPAKPERLWPRCGAGAPIFLHPPRAGQNFFDERRVWRDTAATFVRFARLLLRAGDSASERENAARRLAAALAEFPARAGGSHAGIVRFAAFGSDAEARALLDELAR